MMWAMCVKKLHDKTLYYSNKKSATIVCNCDSMSEKKPMDCHRAKNILRSLS